MHISWSEATFLSQCACVRVCVGGMCLPRDRVLWTFLSEKRIFSLDALRGSLENSELQRQMLVQTRSEGETFLYVWEQEVDFSTQKRHIHFCLQEETGIHVSSVLVHVYVCVCMCACARVAAGRREARPRGGGGEFMVRFPPSLPRPAASDRGGGASGPAQASARLAPFRWAPGTPRVCRGPAARAARSAEFAVRPPLRPGLSPLPRLLPPPGARFLEPPSGLPLRAEPQRPHIRASSTSGRVCFLNRENPFPQMGGSRASLLRGVGPAALPPPPRTPGLALIPPAVYIALVLMV